MLKKLALTLSVSAVALMTFAGSAKADSDDCYFISRDVMKSAMSALAPEIFGWATCAERVPEANQFLMANFSANFNEARLMSYATHLARQTDPSARLTEVTSKSPGPFATRQIILTTITPAHGSVAVSKMTHYFFVQQLENNRYLVFAHSLEEKESKKISSKLMGLQKDLTSEKFLNSPSLSGSIL